MTSEGWLEVHLTDLDNPSSGIPLDVICSTFSKLEDLTYIALEAQQQNQSSKNTSPTALRKRFRERYELRCEPLEAGSLTAPITLMVKSSKDYLFGDLEGDSHQLQQSKQAFFKLLRVVSTSDLQQLLVLIPDPLTAHRVVEVFKNLKPKEGCNLALRSYRSRTDRVDFDYVRDSDKIRQLDKELKAINAAKIDVAKAKVSVQEFTLLAEVKEMNFEDRTYTAISTVNKDLEFDNRQHEKNGSQDKLFEAPHIEVDGSFLVNDEGELLKILQTRSEKPINSDDITIENLRINNEHLRADPPLHFQVTYVKEDACYTLEGDLDIYLYAFSRGELEEALEEMLEFLWLEYAQESDSALAARGKQLKQLLLKRFKRT